MGEHTVTEPDYDLEPEPSQVMADLRKRADRGAKAEKALADAQRELALVKAGVDTTTPLGEFFARSYDGDLNADAVRAEAEKIGLLSAPAAPAQEAIPDEEQAAHERQAALTSDHQPPEAGLLTPETVAEWSVERMGRFAAAHPSEWEQLKQGQGVQSPA